MASKAHMARMKALLNKVERLDLDEPEYENGYRKSELPDPRTKDLYRCGKDGSGKNVDWDAIDMMRTKRK